MKKRVASMLGFVVLLTATAARAESAATEEVAVEPPKATAATTASLPYRARAADPWFTRATVAATGGVGTWNAFMPISGMNTRDTGETNSAGLAIDVYGRRMGFNLALGGSMTENAAAPVEGLNGSSLSTAEMRLAATAVLWNSGGVFLGIGPGLEGRASALGSMESGNEAMASWQTVVAGGDLRARVFAGPHVFFTGSAFYAPKALHGTWQAVDAAGTGGEYVTSGEIRDPRVFAASLAASLRPVDWIAVSGGVAVRDASYKLGGAAGRESGVRPYVGLELLY